MHKKKYTIETLYAAVQLITLLYVQDSMQNIRLSTMSPDYLKEKVICLFGFKGWEQLLKAKIKSERAKLIYKINFKHYKQEECQAIGNIADILTSNSFGPIFYEQRIPPSFPLDILNSLATKMPIILSKEYKAGEISLHASLQKFVNRFFKIYAQEIKIMVL